MYIGYTASTGRRMERGDPVVVPATLGVSKLMISSANVHVPYKGSSATIRWWYQRRWQDAIGSLMVPKVR